MEHSYEACRAKAEELIQDTVCTIGLGARRLADAARRQMELADLRAEVNTCLRELGELLYATHTLRIPTCCWQKCRRSTV